MHREPDIERSILVLALPMQKNAPHPEYLKLLRFVAWKHILDLDVDV